MVKSTKGISFQMENRFVQKALAEMIGENQLTYADACIYNLMRSYAFKKPGQKRVCKIDHRYIAKHLNISPSKVLTRIKKLENLKLITPIYMLQVEGVPIEMTNYEEAVDKYSLRNIKFKNYVIKQLPLEKEMAKTYKKKRS